MVVVAVGIELAGEELVEARSISNLAFRVPPTVHNVHFVKYVFLPTEQAETYLKSCVLINYSTYICLCLFGWKENMI